MILTEEEQLKDANVLEFHKIKEDNESLKNKLQTQFYEINSLKSQLKLASSFEDTKRQPPTVREGVKKSTKLYRLNSTNAKIGNNSHILQGKLFNIWFH